MANATNFGTELVALAQAIVSIQQRMKLDADHNSQDSTLKAAVLQSWALPGNRPDLSSADYDNFMTALQQLTVPFNTGSPLLSSYVYKLL